MLRFASASASLPAFGPDLRSDRAVHPRSSAEPWIGSWTVRCPTAALRYLEKTSQIQTMRMTLQPLKVILLTSPGPLRAQRLKCSELGLHISWAKTKVKYIAAGQPASNLLVNGQTVKGVQSFVYLGSTINSADGSRSQQLRRIGISSWKYEQPRVHLAPATSPPGN